MECTLAALLACFRLSGMYIDTGISIQDSGVESQTKEAAYDFYGGEYHLMDSAATSEHFARNPYGRLSLGYQIDFGNVTWRFEASHLSSLATESDRGVNSIGISARWFPFR